MDVHIGFNYQRKRIFYFKEYTSFDRIEIEGDLIDSPFKHKYSPIEKKYILHVNEWNSLLGHLVFGLPDNYDKIKYKPSFRSLIPYFMRMGNDAFTSPFSHFRKQEEWNIQVNNAFLLGLNWEYASNFQVLKDQKKTFTELKRAATQGLLTGYLGTIGELRTERIRLEDILLRVSEELETFKVHPQYFEIQEEANRLTSELHDISNRLTIDRQLLITYNESIIQEKDVSTEKVKQVYEEAGFVFSDSLISNLYDVSEFHKKLIENRKEYLKTEIERLKISIKNQEFKVEKLSNQRAELLEILKTHGALEEYSKLQTRATGLKQRLEEIKNREENLRRFEEGRNELKLKEAELFQKAQRDYQERKPRVEAGIKLFNRYSERLYNEPGSLSINLKETGYQFKVDIRRAGSQGIDRMKIFCYDLTLANLFMIHRGFPITLIHDSTMFDGVDERQIAKAIELAWEDSEKDQFQYICAFNTDMLPVEDFSEGFIQEFNNHIIGTFTDASDDGGLLGIRF